MTTPQSHKRRGKAFETDLVDWLRDRGHDAERLALAGKDDEGDLVVRIGLDAYLVIEAKAPGSGNAIDLSGWLREAETEAANFAKSRKIDPYKVGYILVIKARGKSIGDAYVVKRLSQHFK